jgi:GNAT superfamily N-acetyltransferase
MAIVVRRAHADEMEAAAHVLVSAFEEYRAPADSAASEEYRQKFERYLAEISDARNAFRDAELFVALEGARVVGAGLLYPPGCTPDYRAPSSPLAWPADWASLRLLGVHPDRRGRKIGRLLAQARVERARELGAPAVAMHTSFEVARGMYTRMGWERAPEFDYFPVTGIRAEAYVLRLEP